MSNDKDPGPIKPGVSNCEVRSGRSLIRCGASAHLYRVEWRGQSLGDYSLCADHCSLIWTYHGDVALIRLSDRTRQPLYAETAPAPNANPEKRRPA